MKFLKKATYIGCINKTIKICPNQHIDLLRFLLTEHSLKTTEPGTSFQTTLFTEFFNERISFAVLQKLAKFHYQTVFTSQII